MNTTKKIFTLLLCASMAASLAACGNKKAAAAPAASGSSASQQIANPFAEYQTLAEAEKAAGVSISVPASIADKFSNCVYRAIDNSLLEIIYTDGKDGDEIRIRKAAGTDDISGDYNQYAETSDVSIGGSTVSFKGSDGKVSLAVWTADGQSYSVSGVVDGGGLSKTTMTDIVSSIGSGGQSADAAAEATDFALDGGWEYNQGELSLSKNAAAQAAYDKALDGLVGCSYEPVALLGSQVVSGTNYCILCKATPVVPNAESEYILLYIYADLNGNASITNDVPLDLAGLAG